jgi:G3E family GTPase
VDSVFGETQSGRHPEFGKQVALADCLVLTKTDLAASERVERLKAILRDRNPSAPIVATVHGAIDAGSLFSSVFFDRDVLTTRPRRPALFADNSDPAHLGRHAVVSLTADQPLDWHAFDGWLRRIRISHAENLLRVKGMMDIGGVDGPVVIQGIHHVLDAPVELDGWPAGERRSRLVLIGDSATIAAVRGSWAAAFQGMIANR